MSDDFRLLTPGELTQYTTLFGPLPPIATGRVWNYRGEYVIEVEHLDLPQEPASND